MSGVIRIPGDSAQVDLEALRERAATALELALGFVQTHGDALAKLRADVVLRSRPGEELIEALAARQADDGSFAAFDFASPILSLSDAVAPEIAVGAGSGGAHAVSPELLGTLETLAVLSDLRSLYAPCVDAAVDFVTGLQGEDGAWRGSGHSDVEAIFSTGVLAGFLGRTRTARPTVLTGAGTFLAGLWSPDLVEGGRWSAITAFSSYFSNVPDDLSDEAMQWCGRELERGFRSRRFEALAVVRVLLYCDAAALPGANIEPVELVTALLGEQARDGGFCELAPGGAPARVSPTIDAMLALIELCKAL